MAENVLFFGLAGLSALSAQRKMPKTQLTKYSRAHTDKNQLHDPTPNISEALINITYIIFYTKVLLNT